MTPIRVLYLDHVVHLSGAEQSLFDLVVGLAGGPVEPVVVLPEDGPLATQLRASGVLVRKVKMSKRLLDTSRATLKTRPFVAVARLVSFLAVAIRLRRIIKEMRPQIIHTNTLKAHLFAIIPAKLTRTPLVWHVRDILPKSWLRRAFTFCARFTDRIVVPSRAVAQSFGRDKIVYRKLRLIPNGIRIDTFGDRDEGLAMREELECGRKDVLVGIVGRIAPWKGQDVFVHAAAMVAERYPVARFAIVGVPMFGDDQFQHDLASLVYQYGLDGRVMFAGWRTAQEAMGALDVVVHASIEPEPFGRTIVEAMASGLPVVAAGGGAVGEILPPNAGFIVPPGRPEILADAIENLLEDRNLRKEMGENGKEAAARFFDVRRTVGAVGTLYGEIARESAKRAMLRARKSGALAVLLRKIRKQPAAPRGVQPRGMQPRVPGMPPRRPDTTPLERRPPVLRPEPPDGMRGPQRRRSAPPVFDDAPVKPVRRTARIDEDDDAPAASAPSRRPPAARREPVAPGRRPIPAMRERAPEEPSRRVHRPVSYEGGHVIRRPIVLDDPRYAAEAYPLDTEVVAPPRPEPTRRPSRRAGRAALPDAAEILLPEAQEVAPEPGPEPVVDEPTEVSADLELVRDDAETDEEPKRPVLRRLIGGARRAKRPAPEIAVSMDSTAPVLEPLPEIASRPVFKPKPPAEDRPEAPRREPVVVPQRPAASAEPARKKPKPAAVVPAPAPDRVVAPLRMEVPHRPVYEAVKRIIDIVVALLVLVVGSPVWLLVALAIKLDSDGPALFKGTVWGKDCKPFTYYKFRSMRPAAADDGHRDFIAQYVTQDSGVASHDGKTVYKFVGDSRITRVGKLIRKLSIDEIPQLVNVLKGEMSLVGPRPPLGYEYELYDDWAKQRMVVRPGMTGLQQTYARHSAAFTEKVEMDLAYIRDRSLWLDITILLKTIPAAFKGE